MDGRRCLYSLLVLLPFVFGLGGDLARAQTLKYGGVEATSSSPNYGFPADAGSDYGNGYVVSVQNSVMSVYDNTLAIKNNCGGGGTSVCSWGDNSTNHTCSSGTGGTATGLGCFWQFDYDTGAFDSSCGTSGHSACIDWSDPRVVYDSLNGHWIVSTNDGNEGQTGALYVYVAVSNGANPTNGTWTQYRVSTGCPSGFDLADFPQLGLSASWLLMTVDCATSSGGFNGATLHALELSPLEAGTYNDSTQNHVHSDPYINTTTGGAGSLPARFFNGTSSNTSGWFVAAHDELCTTCTCPPCAMSGPTFYVSKVHGTVSSPTWDVDPPYTSFTYKYLTPQQGFSSVACSCPAHYAPEIATNGATGKTGDLDSARDGSADTDTWANGDRVLEWIMAIASNPFETPVTGDCGTTQPPEIDVIWCAFDISHSAHACVYAGGAYDGTIERAYPSAAHLSSGSGTDYVMWHFSYATTTAGIKDIYREYKSTSGIGGLALQSDVMPVTSDNAYSHARWGDYSTIAPDATDGLFYGAGVYGHHNASGDSMDNELSGIAP